MRPCTDRFRTVVAGSHTMRTTVDVLFAGAPVEGATGLAVDDGTFMDDATAAVRTRVDVTFAEPLRLPTTSASPLSPFGWELQVRRGIVYSDGSAELPSLGVFPIQTADSGLRSKLTQVVAFDRTQLVIDARLEDDYTVAAGTNYATAIGDLIRSALPGLVVALPPTTFTTPLLTVPSGSDRWATATQWAAACGWQLRFDGVGRLVGLVEPSPATAVPVWEITEGVNIVDAGMRLDRGQAYNRWIVSGENSSLGAVYKGTATDDDPQSDLFYGRGPKPTFYSSPLFTSDDQCATYAAAWKSRSIGVARSITFTVPPNPTLESCDAVLLTAPTFGQTGRVHLLDRLQLGLTATAPSEATTRTVGA